MYAIFKTGGKQYRVETGDIIRVEKLDAEEGKTITFEDVLAISDDNGLQTGTPFLDAASVTANVLSQGKGDKVIIFKFKAKKDYRNKQGHRQPYTEIEIESIALGGKTLAKKEKPAKAKKADKVDKAAEEVKEVIDEGSEALVEEDAVKEAEVAAEEVATVEVVAEVEEIEKAPSAEVVEDVKEEAETAVKEVKEKAPAKKPAAKKAPAKKADTAEKKTTAKKADTTEKKAPAKKPAAKKTPAKKADSDKTEE